MAYLDLDNAFASPVGATCPAPIAEAVAGLPGFTALEWSVIALAKRDPLRSLSQPGRVSRAMGGLFGRGARSRLADDRLEALRRLAVHAWHHGFALPMREIEAFVAAGFLAAQVETLVASITGVRIGRRA
ncbi:hypothetical protein [uncultured Sphingomonas sp.]|uniref:hypothetical protein n=1 Tax=uncultured Sphingomonas sp. TaxID=158754 RepID=UPI0035C9B902